MAGATYEYDLKQEFWSTREDALAIFRRLHEACAPLGYYASLYGSSLLKGGGHDVDAHALGLGREVERATPDGLCMVLIKKLAHTVKLYQQYDVGDVSDCYLVCTVKLRRELHLLDLHVKGDAGL